MKGYKVKSSTARTAKKEFGADYKEKGTIVRKEDGMFYFELNDSITIDVEAVVNADKITEPESVITIHSGERPEKAVLAAIEKPTEAPTVEQCDKVLSHVAEVTGKANLEAVTIQEDVTVSVDKLEVTKPPQLKASWRDNPCKAVWDIAESMPGAKRKDILAACVEMGIAYNTARTQYQRFFTASKG